MNALLTVVLLLVVNPPEVVKGSDPIRLVAGGGDGGDGSKGADTRMLSPFGLGVLGDGSIVFVEMTGHRVRTIDANGAVQTFAGTGAEGAKGDGGPARDAEFNGMHALVIDRANDLLIADTWNQRVRRIRQSDGSISTIVGTGEKGFSGDGGPATSAKFGGIYSIALSVDGRTMFLCDLDNRRIRAVDRETGLVRTVAGNGKKGVPRDGELAVESPLVDPRAVAVDASGNLYILERGGHALRLVKPDGTISTVVGTGKAGLSGDGGKAIEATLNGPKDLIVDRDGSVLIADTENHCIRRYRPSDGTIVRVAGTGTKGKGGLGGPAQAAELAQPHGVAIDRDGSLLISDSSNHRILRVGGR